MIAAVVCEVRARAICAAIDVAAQGGRAAAADSRQGAPLRRSGSLRGRLVGQPVSQRGHLRGH